jgi:hypothetical protein
MHLDYYDLASGNSTLPGDSSGAANIASNICARHIRDRRI